MKYGGMSTSDSVTTQSPTLSSEDRSARIAVTVFPLLILAAFAIAMITPDTFKPLPPAPSSSRWSSATTCWATSSATWLDVWAAARTRRHAPGDVLPSLEERWTGLNGRGWGGVIVHPRQLVEGRVSLETITGIRRSR